MTVLTAEQMCDRIDILEMALVSSFIINVALIVFIIGLYWGWW